MARDRRGRRRQRGGWCVGPGWLVLQPQMCVLTECATTFGIPYVSFLLLCRFSFLLTTPVVCRCFGLDLEVAFVVSGEWNKSSLLGILLWDWTRVVPDGALRPSRRKDCHCCFQTLALHFLRNVSVAGLSLVSLSRYARYLGASIVGSPVGDSLFEGLREEPSMMDKLDSGCFAQ